MTNIIPVFCQFLQDQLTLSKHQKVFHHIIPHLILSDVWGDVRRSTHFGCAAPARIMPTHRCQMKKNESIILFFGPEGISIFSKHQDNTLTV